MERRALPCHNITCYRYIYFTENELWGKKQQEKMHNKDTTYTQKGRKNTLTTQKREQHQKKRMKEAREDTGGNKPPPLTWKRRENDPGWILCSWLLRWDAKQAFTPTCVFPLERIECSSEINHHDVWPHLINKWKGRTTTGERKKRLVRREAIRIQPAYSIAYFYSNILRKFWLYFRSVNRFYFFIQSLTLHAE